MKLHILKVTNKYDHLSDVMYYTIPFLRDLVIKDWYDVWDETSITKEQIIESDEMLLNYMDKSGYNVEVILTITEQDIKEHLNKNID